MHVLGRLDTAANGLLLLLFLLWARLEADAGRWKASDPGTTMPGTAVEPNSMISTAVATYVAVNYLLRDTGVSVYRYQSRTCNRALTAGSQHITCC